MKRFENLSHTADAKFKAFGKNDEEKFTNAAIAMFNIILKTEEINEVKKHEITVSAKTIRGLLYDFFF